MKHDDAIEWPNGEGFTPCSREYAEICDQIDAMSACGAISMDDMSPADYQTYNILLDRRSSLQANGHVGKSVRY